MVIEFSVANFCSFDQLQTLSFRATKLDSLNEKVEGDNVMLIENQRILKIVGAYGANASGKTNLIKALTFFKDMVSNSVLAEGLSTDGVNPFRQAANSKKRPSYFQVVLLIEDKKYRYGFTLKNNADIGSEWLFGPADKNETFYFKRTSNNIQTNTEWFDEGTALPEDNLRSDALFLSFCSSYNGAISKRIRNFWYHNVTVDANISRRGNRAINVFAASPFNLTNRLLDSGKHDLILTWLKEVGLVYNGIRMPKDEAGFSNSIFLSKNVFDDNGNIVGETEMNLNQDESEGTKKFYTYIGKLYRKFQQGGLYVCDEIDSNFHPSLLQKIIKLFQNPLINKANAQLLFTSHDTNLMDPCIMRRDQFYFSEKNLYDATKLYSLADLKGIRNNADFARQYLAGLYGALPILSDFLEDDAQNDQPSEKYEIRN